MVCKHCGQPFDEETHDCPVAGNDLSPAEAVEPPPEDPPP